MKVCLVNAPDLTRWYYSLCIIQTIILRNVLKHYKKSFHKIFTFLKQDFTNNLLLLNLGQEDDKYIAYMFILACGLLYNLWWQYAD